MVDFDPRMESVTRLDRRLTARDLDSLPHEWDTRYELIAGVLFLSTKPSPLHQAIVANLLVALHPVVARLGGIVLPEAGIVWSERGQDSVAPDLAVLLPPVPRGNDRIRRTPEICIEVLSPGKENQARDLRAKRALYWRKRATEYWIVDPKHRRVLQLTRATRGWKVRELRPEDTLSTPVLDGGPGVKVSDLFAYPR